MTGISMSKGDQGLLGGYGMKTEEGKSRKGLYQVWALTVDYRMSSLTTSTCLGTLSPHSPRGGPPARPAAQGENAEGRRASAALSCLFLPSVPPSLWAAGDLWPLGTFAWCLPRR